MASREATASLIDTRHFPNGPMADPAPWLHMERTPENEIRELEQRKQDLQTKVQNQRLQNYSRSKDIASYDPTVLRMLLNSEKRNAELQQTVNELQGRPTVESQRDLEQTVKELQRRPTVESQQDLQQENTKLQDRLKLTLKSLEQQKEGEDNDYVEEFESHKQTKLQVVDLQNKLQRLEAANGKARELHDTATKQCDEIRSNLLTADLQKLRLRTRLNTERRKNTIRVNQTRKATVYAGRLSLDLEQERQSTRNLQEHFKAKSDAHDCLSIAIEEERKSRESLREQLKEKSEAYKNQKLQQAHSNCEKLEVELRSEVHRLSSEETTYKTRLQAVVDSRGSILTLICQHLDVDAAEINMDQSHLDNENLLRAMNNQLLLLEALAEQTKFVSDKETQHLQRQVDKQTDHVKQLQKLNAAIKESLEAKVELHKVQETKHLEYRRDLETATAQLMAAKQDVDAKLRQSYQDEHTKAVQVRDLERQLLQANLEIENLKAAQTANNEVYEEMSHRLEVMEYGYDSLTTLFMES